MQVVPLGSFAARTFKLVLALFVVVLGQAAAQIPTQQLVIPQFAAGEGWETDLALVAQGSQPSAGLIQFFGQGGFPLEVSVNGSAPTALIEYRLTPGATANYRLSAGTGLRLGYAVVNSSLDGSERGAVGALATFRLVREGRVVSQVGVAPAEFYRTGFLLFDNRGTSRTALAIAANGFDDTSIRFSRLAPEGAFVESTLVELPAGTQRAFFVDELFAGSSGQRGLLVAQSDAVFNWTSLNLNGLILSGAPPLPEVLEWDLRLSPQGGETSQWKLRLLRNSTVLSGVADRLSPSPSNEFLVSGTLLEADFYGSSQGSLNLNISSRDGDTAQVLALIARFEDPNLNGNIDGALVQYDQSGKIIAQGTFRLRR